MSDEQPKVRPCPQCDAQVPLDELECPECGAELEGDSASSMVDKSAADSFPASDPPSH